MRDRPLEAFVIARGAADSLKDRDDQFRRLFRLAARLQEEQLRLLTAEQVEELADVYRKTLNDREAAELAQRRWLKMRRAALGPADEAGRLRLAQQVWQWLRDREEAADLCIQALTIDPDLKAAVTLLEGELSYQRTERGWRARDRASVIDRGGKEEPRDLTIAQVLNRYGPPHQVSRQILFRRRLEQWTYGRPHFVRVELDFKIGQDPQVLNVHPSNRSKP